MIRSSSRPVTSSAQIALLAIVALFSPRLLRAQTNPMTDAVRMMATHTGKNILEAARAMPADKFAFKPTPSQIAFAELILHIADDSRKTCGALSSSAAPPEAKLSRADGKEKLVAALQRAIDFCGTALARAKDASLGDQVSWYGSRTTRAMAMVGLVADWTDHYAQEAMYLRLNGLVPPSARRASR